MATARGKTPAQKDPLVFSGPPGRLSADLTVANTGDRRLAVRGLTALRKGSPDLDVQAAALGPPGATASTQGTLPADSGTSPADDAAGVQGARLPRAGGSGATRGRAGWPEDGTGMKG